MNSEQLIQLLNNMADIIIENKENLNDLDRAIGDADHGINMTRGFTEVKLKLEGLQGKDPSTILKTVAMALISTVGGASGPLYGTAFMKAAGVVTGKETIEGKDLIPIYEEVIEGIKARGKSDKGCKTMLDALIPAYEAYKETYESSGDFKVAAAAAEQAAFRGVEYTKEIIATKGRASYLGERSIGHADPGATSSHLLIKTIAIFV